MSIAWGQGINSISWGTVYNQSWVSEYIFTSVVGDANDLEQRVADDSGTMEAHICLVNNMKKSLR